MAMETGDTAMRRIRQARRIKVRAMVAQARRSEETGRILNAAALPFAAMIVVLWGQAMSLSREGDLTLATLAPVVWGGIAFAGVATAFLYWHHRQG
jgi:hypothetical protein